MAKYSTGSDDNARSTRYERDHRFTLAGWSLAILGVANIMLGPSLPFVLFGVLLAYLGGIVHGVDDIPV